MSKINQQIQRAAERYKESGNNVELKEDILSILSELKNSEAPEEKSPLHIGDMATERLNQLIQQDLLDKQIIKTGFEDYDEEFCGLLKGEFVVIGGRPGMGKTQFVVNLCTNIASAGKAVAYISLELSNFLVSNRFIGNLSKVCSQDLLKGDLKEQDEFNVKAAVTKLNKLPIYVYDQYNSSIYSILDRCRQLVVEQKVEAIFVDYLQLVTANSKRFNREAELALITRELKKLAKELNIVM
jgi:replicative DNA helicase